LPHSSAAGFGAMITDAIAPAKAERLIRRGMSRRARDDRPQAPWDHGHGVDVVGLLLWAVYFTVTKAKGRHVHERD